MLRGPPVRLPGGKGPSNRQTIGVRGDSVLPGLCGRLSSLSFSPRTRILCFQRERIENLKITHPDFPTINRLTIKGGGAKANGTERGRDWARSVSDSNTRQKKNKTLLTLLGKSDQILLKRGVLNGDLA